MTTLLRDLRDTVIIILLVGVIVAVFCLVFPPPAANAAPRCATAAAVAVQTQFIAVPVAVPAGYPVYASPVGNVGMVAYGSSASTAAGAKAADSTTREAQSVVGPVPPSPDGKPYGQYLAEWRDWVSASAVVASFTSANTKGLTPAAGGAAEAQAAPPAPPPSLIERYCVSCHSPGGKAKHLDLTAGVPDAAIRKTLKRLLSTDPKVTMPPPDHPIDDRARGELLAEIADD